MGCQRASGGVGGVKGVLGGWQGVQVLNSQKAYRWHKEALGAHRGCWGC